LQYIHIIQKYVYTITVEEAKTALIELLKEQVTQLSIMSKIELGDDVIEEYNKLNDIIEAKQQS